MGQKLQHLKCSFTDKRVLRPNENTTIVEFTGKIPISFHTLQQLNPLMKWINKQKQVEIHEGLFPCRLMFKVKGKAIKAKTDTDDLIFAERLAEARAKRKLYEFCEVLMLKLHYYYSEFPQSLIPIAQVYEDRRNKEIEHIADLITKKYGTGK